MKFELKKIDACLALGGIALSICCAFFPRISNAAAECPAGSKVLFQCQSTPKAGDSEVAIQIFDSITVCDQAGKALLAVEKDGQGQEVVDAQVEDRMGARTYSTQAENVKFSFSVTTTARPNLRNRNARLFISLQGLQADATYTCQ